MGTDLFAVAQFLKLRIMGHTQESISADLTELGVVSGDILFVHSSYKSLGQVDGGPKTVIKALEDAVGKTGLILMPVFHLIDRPLRHKLWDFYTTPSTVGWLTEYFRRMTGTFRSDHYSHSVAGRGKNAESFVSQHRSFIGRRSPWDLDPWGRTFGSNSPMHRAYNREGKLLMIGTDYDTCTYIHLVEVIHWNQRLEKDDSAAFNAIHRPVVGDYWDSSGSVVRGSVGDSDCRLFQIRQFIDEMVIETGENPQPYWRDYWPQLSS